MWRRISYSFPGSLQHLLSAQGLCCWETEVPAWRAGTVIQLEIPCAGPMGFLGMLQRGGISGRLHSLGSSDMLGWLSLP